MTRNVLADRSGSVAIGFAFVLPVIGLGMGFAVDYSRLSHERSELQSAADAAALAGARELGMSDGQPAAFRERLASETAEKLLAVKKPEAERDTESSLEDASVTVRLASAVPQVFGGFLGRRTREASVASKATYMVEEVVAACVIALGASEPVGIDLQGSAEIEAPRCGVWSNSGSSASILGQGAVRIDADRICAVGSAQNARGMSPAPESGCDPAPDPYAGLEIPPAGAGCDASDLAIDTKGSMTLHPGIYCGGISIEAGHVLLEPGLYVLKDGPLALKASSSLAGTAVSILLTGAGADLSLEGGPEVSLTATDAGPLAGIALMMAEDGNHKTANLQGNPSIEASGAIYLPDTPLLMQGNPRIRLSGERDKLVALSFQLIGNPEILVEADDAGERAKDLVELRLIR